MKRLEYNTPTGRGHAPLTKALRTLWGGYIAPLFSRNKVLPSLIVIGGQKCGTSSLHYYLAQHASIIGPARKEVHFFDYNYWRGLDWYRTFFPSMRDVQRNTNENGRAPFVFEASPYYLFHPAVPARIHHELPEAKLIVLLRDPIDRAFSHYWHEVRRGNETKSFCDALHAEIDRLGNEEQRLLTDPYYRSFNYEHFSYVDRGLYAKQIERWLKLFDRNAIIFVRSESFFANPAHEVQRIFDALGLRRNVNIDYKPRNVGNYRAQIDSRSLDFLINAFADERGRLTEIIGPEFSWDHSR